MCNQEELKKKQDAFAKSQEDLKKLLTVIHGKIEEEQDRIRKFATQVQAQETQLQDSTVKRLAQLDRIDRDQVNEAMIDEISIFIYVNQESQ